MPSGLVTTIIPVHNRPELLREAVASVLEQTYRPIEIIIVDDGSTDATPEVADQLAREHPGEILVVHQPNRGVGVAREAGRLLAKGEFIQYLDSDDRLLPRKFEMEVAALRTRPECDVAYGWTRYKNDDDTVSSVPARRTGEQIATMFPSMLQARWWHTPTPLYRRSVVDDAGPWTDLAQEEDWEYDARIAARGARLAFVDGWTTEFRRHSGPRLSGRGRDPSVLRHRARAHILILAHARTAGIEADQPEMQHFARELFLLARQCGAAGLGDESAMLFHAARDASGVDANRIQFRLYRGLAGILGWRTMGRVSDLFDRMRRR